MFFLKSSYPLKMINGNMYVLRDAKRRGGKEQNERGREREKTVI